MLDFEDISVFFQDGEFARPVLIEASGETITAIFDNGHNDFATGMGLNGSDTSPKLIVKAADAANLTAGMNGTVVVIESIRYQVVDKEPDITKQTYIFPLQKIS